MHAYDIAACTPIDPLFELLSGFRNLRKLVESSDQDNLCSEISKSCRNLKELTFLGFGGTQHGIELLVEGCRIIHKFCINTDEEWDKALLSKVGILIFTKMENFRDFEFSEIEPEELFMKEFDEIKALKPTGLNIESIFTFRLW